MPSVADIAAGHVTLTLTAAGNAPCGNATSSLTLTIVPAATASAGGNQSMCASAASYALVGATATNFSSLSWGTSGSGTFTGGTTLTPSYTPSIADITAGHVTLTLTAVGNAPCGNAISTMTLTIVPAATANAGGNKSMCASAANYTLAGATATNFSSLNWTTSGTGTFTGGTTLTPTYTPGPADILAGNVILTLTATGNAPCGNATNTMTLTIVPAATANAGGNQSMCASAAIYTIAGASATNFSSLSWGTSGTGSFAGGTTLTPAYTPSAADIAAGHVTLTLTAVGNAPCGNATSSMTLTIVPGATASAGGNKSMCASAANYTIAGATATNFSSLSWGTSGTGTFTNGATLTPTYTPGVADILAGSSNPTLTAAGNAPCGNATSPMTLTIVPVARRMQEADQSMCSSAANYSIAGAAASNFSSSELGDFGVWHFLQAAPL